MFLRYAGALALLPLLLAAPAMAHPIHGGCDSVEIWVDAYLDQLLVFWIDDNHVIHFRGDPMSGIVCLPIDDPLREVIGTL